MSSLSTAGISYIIPELKKKIKINFLTACRLADTGRAHPISLKTLGGPTQKKTKKFNPRLWLKIQSRVVHQGQMKLVWVLKIGIIKIFFCHIPIFPSTRIVPKISEMIFATIPIISTSFSPRIFFTHYHWLV